MPYTRKDGWATRNYLISNEKIKSTLYFHRRPPPQRHVVAAAGFVGPSPRQRFCQYRRPGGRRAASANGVPSGGGFRRTGEILLRRGGLLKRRFAAGHAGESGPAAG